jgi:RimJ/RimL family protein N-acetyltransferase
MSDARVADARTRPNPAPSTAPLLQGRFVELAPLTDAGVGLLWQWETHPSNFLTYRLRGITPSAENYHRLVWDSALAQFLVMSRAENRPIGVVSGYKDDMRSGTCHIAAIYDPEVLERGQLRGDLEGVELFCEYLFRVFNMRKLYFEVFDWNLPKFGSFLYKMCSHEAHLVEHEYFDGRYWDLHVFALSRERWVRQARELDDMAEAIRAAARVSENGEDPAP